MHYLKERGAYLRGLVEGMHLSDATNEGKQLKAIIEVLDDVALAVDDMEEVQEQMSEQIDNIDEDLAEIERIVFDEEEYDDYVDAGEIEIECPHCSEKVTVDEDVLEDESSTIECPYCHKDIEVEWGCDCGKCDEDKT